MTDWFLVLIFLVMITACFAEWYKKRLRGYTAEDGSVKTKASKWEMWGVTFAFSLLMAVMLVLYGGGLTIGWWALIPYSIGIWLFQYLVSMKMIKAWIKSLMGVEKDD